MGLYLDLIAIQFVYMSILMPVPHCFNYSFEVSFKIGKCESSDFVLLFQDCFGYLGLLKFHKHLKISFFKSSENKGCCNFDRNWLESIYHFGQYLYLKRC